MRPLTIFTAPKPFVDSHISTIQRNAISSWKKISEDVDIVLLGNDPGIADAARELDVRHIPQVKCNEKDTPIISSMFGLTRTAYPASTYIMANADIIFFPEIIQSIKNVMRQAEKFLIVGQRWDLSCEELLDFSPGWEEKLNQRVNDKGKLHPPGGSDYFIFPHSCYQQIPDFAIGRAGWDNWMIYEGRRNGWKVIDATKDICIIHQNHDYHHLPEGKPHYRLPETFENVRLAGGDLTIFTLRDCNYALVSKRMTKVKFSWQKFWREIEIFPLIRLHSYTLARVFFTFFHPIKAYRDFRSRVKIN